LRVLVPEAALSAVRSWLLLSLLAGAVINRGGLAGAVASPCGRLTAAIPRMPSRHAAIQVIGRRVER
jgi:hypothetical protein